MMKRDITKFDDDVFRYPVRNLQSRTQAIELLLETCKLEVIGEGTIVVSQGEDDRKTVLTPQGSLSIANIFRTSRKVVELYESGPNRTYFGINRDTERDMWRAYEVYHNSQR